MWGIPASPTTPRKVLSLREIIQSFITNKITNKIINKITNKIFVILYKIIKIININGGVHVRSSGICHWRESHQDVIQVHLVQNV